MHFRLKVWRFIDKLPIFTVRILVVSNPKDVLMALLQSYTRSFYKQNKYNDEEICEVTPKGWDLNEDLKLLK